MLMRQYASLADALSAHDSRWERPFVCPVHDDTNASASLNVQKGVWVCYACGASGGTQGIEYDEKLDLRFLDHLLDEPRVFSDQYLDMFVSEEIHPYWLSRFTEAACRHFQLGFDPASGRPCYPMRNPQGDLLGVITRNLDHDGPKYRYPQGVKKQRLLFNYSPAERDVVILVEGAMDVIACWEAGFTAFGIYGSSLSAAQVQLVQALAPGRVVLGYDNDHAGRKCVRESAESLAVETVAIDWSRWGAHGDDLGELPVGIRKTLLEELSA